MNFFCGLHINLTKERIANSIPTSPKIFHQLDSSSSVNEFASRVPLQFAPKVKNRRKFRYILRSIANCAPVVPPLTFIKGSAYRVTTRYYRHKIRLPTEFEVASSAISIFRGRGFHGRIFPCLFSFLSFLFGIPARCSIKMRSPGRSTINAACYDCLATIRDKFVSGFC